MQIVIPGLHAAQYDADEILADLRSAHPSARYAPVDPFDSEDALVPFYCTVDFGAKAPTEEELRRVEATLSALESVTWKSDLRFDTRSFRGSDDGSLSLSGAGTEIRLRSLADVVVRYGDHLTADDREQMTRRIRRVERPEGATSVRMLSSDGTSLEERMAATLTTRAASVRALLDPS